MKRAEIDKLEKNVAMELAAENELISILIETRAINRNGKVIFLRQIIDALTL